jgi:hypothetical protein
VSSSRRLRCMSRLDFRRSQHLSSPSPVSRWQRDHEGSRRNAIGKFRWGHGLCAGDGGRLGAELAGAQTSAHRATAGVRPSFRAIAISCPLWVIRVGPAREYVSSTLRAELLHFVPPVSWCGRSESNRHSLWERHLSAARLPSSATPACPRRAKLRLGTYPISAPELSGSVGDVAAEC